MNNLSDVYRLHCGGDALKKSDRDVFVKGNIQEIRELFQVLYSNLQNLRKKKSKVNSNIIYSLKELTFYCSQDVVATAKVYKALWPQFKERYEQGHIF